MPQTLKMAGKVYALRSHAPMTVDGIDGFFIVADETTATTAPARRMKIRCLDDGLEFPTDVAAAKHYGLSKSHVGKLANGRIVSKIYHFERLTK